MNNRRLVAWVRWTFYAAGVALAVSLLSFIFIARGGGEHWRTLLRVCVWFGWLATLLLFLAKVVGVRMIEHPGD
jgi:Flp pilus assembly protein protease CpaA